MSIIHELQNAEENKRNVKSSHNIDILAFKDDLRILMSHSYTLRIVKQTTFVYCNIFKRIKRDGVTGSIYLKLCTFDNFKLLCTFVYFIFIVFV